MATAAPPAGWTAARGIAAGIAAATIWSGWYVLARHGVTAGGLNAFDLAALRFVVAAPLLMLLLRRLPFPAARFAHALVMAIGVGPAFVIAVGTGFQASTASFGGAMSAVSGVLLTLIASRFLLRERLGPAQKTGILIAVAGLAALTLTAPGGGSPGWFLLGGLLWASYGVAFRKSALSALEAVTAVALLSAIVYLPVYFLIAGGRLWQAPAPELILQGLAQGVLTGIVALALHARAVADLGATKAALFQSLVPPITLILSFFFLNETPSPTEIACVGLILIGVATALGFRNTSGT